MTREELLAQLNEIKSAVDNDTAALKLTDEERAIQLRTQREYLTLEIAQLQEKLSSDDNYVLAEYTELQGKIEEVGKKKLIQTLKTVENQRAIADLEAEIAEIDRNLDASRALWGELKQVSQLDNDAQTYLTNEIHALEARKAACKASLDTLNQQKLDLANQAASYDESLKLYQQKLGEYTSTIDVAKKTADTAKLENLQNRLQFISSTSPYLLYTFSNDIADLISNVEAGYITNEGVVNRLNILATKYPEKEESVVAEQLAANQASQTEISSEIALLETRLESDINYTPSRMQKDRLESEIVALESSENDYSAAIASLTADIASQERVGTSIETSMEHSKQRRDEIENENRGLRLRLSLEPNITQAQSKEITKRITKNTSAIKKIDGELERYRKNLASNSDMIKSLESRRKGLENLRSQETKKKEERQRLFEDTTTIDVVAQEADRNRLAVLVSQLDTLKASERAIGYDYKAHLEQLKTTLLGNNSVNLETPSAQTPEPEVSVAPVGTNSREDEIIEAVQEAVDEEFSNNANSDEPIDADYEQVEENEKTVPLPIVLWKKAKRTVLEKIRDHQFMRRAKATFAAMVVALGLGIGLSRCSNYEANVASPPAITETVEDDLDEEKDFDEVILDTLEDEQDIQDGLDTEPDPDDLVQETESTGPEGPGQETEPTTPEGPSQETELTTPEGPSQEIEPTNPEGPGQEPESSEPVTGEVTQEVQQGEVGVLVTGSGEDQNVAITDNEASDVLSDAAQELADRYAEETGSSTGDSFTDENVTGYSYGEDGGISVEASTGDSITDTTLEDVIENIAQESHGSTETGEESLDDIFSAINDEVVDELTEGRSR